MATVGVKELKGLCTYGYILDSSSLLVNERVVSLVAQQHTQSLFSAIKW